MQSQFLARFQTILSLGIVSVFHVVVYRALKKFGYYKWRTPMGATPGQGSLLGHPDAPLFGGQNKTAVAPAELAISGEIAIFGSQSYKTGSPPAWQTNSANGHGSKFSNQHWSRVADFDPEFGDIKLVWELSRFQWILLFARAYLQSGDSRYIDSANEWARDWIEHNPVNSGLNWMCGQETSIRLVHVLLSEKLLSTSDTKSELLEFFVLSHCERISATTSYAAAQKNNHIISEAAGLIIGGSWLEKYASSAGASKNGLQWRQLGYSILEKSIARLVMEDGSFAQYSVVYHRLLLDTLSIAEWWRDRMSLPSFSERLYSRARAATRWLYSFVDESNGDAPNLGANDGALVYALSDSGRRDFRPTVQLAGYLFCKEDFYGPGPWNEPIETLGVAGGVPRANGPDSEHFPRGGFSVIRSHFDSSRMYCRFPNFRFRPSQSDALHVDLWREGVNILRDGGTYSYAAPKEDLDYFMGSSSHNTTCRFDDRDQMPKLGRFLFGPWLRADNVVFTSEGDRQVWQAGYTDLWRCSHQRTVESTEKGWIITDNVNGPFKSMTLRWRLCPEFEWQLSDGGVYSDTASIRVSSESDPSDMGLSAEHESRFYLEKQPISVLRVRYPAGAKRIVTKVSFGERVQ
jgi:hypothetical protein